MVENLKKKQSIENNEANEKKKNLKTVVNIKPALSNISHTKESGYIHIFSTGFHKQ